VAPNTGTAAVHRAIEAVWRIESARIIAGLAGLVRDVGLAEELAQDALVAALEQWPADASRRTLARGSCSPPSITPSTASAATSGSPAS
jgi:DNA-directed RNA polymerase specialized sigma24 family protein